MILRSYTLAIIVFWLTLSMGSTRINLDQMPEMGLQGLTKVYKDRYTYTERATPQGIPIYQPRVPIPPWDLNRGNRLRVIRDQWEHVK
jgi:hypothetical protein